MDLPRLLREHAAERYGEGVVDGLLREDALELDQKMTQLFKWGTVESWQDRAELETDFLRNRERYQLTQQAAELCIDSLWPKNRRSMTHRHQCSLGPR
ncbi:hypothetical protein SALBM311S_03891 [Streptomyces alboniger]